MIRMIQKQLIIPRGDTGTFSIPVIATSSSERDASIFTIFDPLNHKRIFQKEMEEKDGILNMNFTHADTVNLPVGQFVWDIKFYKNVEKVDGVFINGTEIDSYYAAYKLPICEIRQTGDALLTADDAPTSTVNPEQLNIIQAAAIEIKEAQDAIEQNATIAAEAAEQAVTAATSAENSASAASNVLDEMRELIPTVPTKISDLIDDSGHYIKPSNGIPAADLAPGVIPEIPLLISTDTNPVENEHSEGEIFVADGTLWRVIETISPAETLKPDVNVEQITLNSILDDKADKTDTVLNTFLSLGRDSNSTKGRYSIAAGTDTIASGNNSVATGFWTVATGQNSHAEGNSTRATGQNSHAEGQGARASGLVAHAEGDNTTADGTTSHAEGRYSHAIGYGAHVEGRNNVARGTFSHVEGYDNETISNQAATHVSGVFSVPTNQTGKTITIQGDKRMDGTITPNSGTMVLGKYAEVIGNGTNNSTRSNARVLDWDGNEYLNGNLYVNANADSSGGTLVATISDLPQYATDLETQALITGWEVST